MRGDDDGARLIERAGGKSGESLIARMMGDAHHVVTKKIAQPPHGEPQPRFHGAERQLQGLGDLAMGFAVEE